MFIFFPRNERNYMYKVDANRVGKMDFIANNYRVDIQYIGDLVDRYGKMGAAKILSESLDKNVDNTYVAGTLYALSLRENAHNMIDVYRERHYLLDDAVRTFIIAHYDVLADVLVHDRDYGFQFAAVKTIAKNYLFKINGEPIESIQWAWMRIAVQVAAPDKWSGEYSSLLEEVIETYNILSLREGLHATPTCINAGYRIPQLESCFLARIGDSMLSIADIQKLLLMGSKCNGGFGIFVGDIRHSRVGNRGITKGVIGLAKVINGLVPYADQLGSRPMAVNLILPIWHCDIPVFITMKDENSPINVKATLLNYTVSIPDLFMKRYLQGGNWSLFCPRECKMLWVKEHGGNQENTHEVDAAPSLCDVWGEQFEQYYLMCERGGITKSVMRARDLHAGIHTYRCMIGEPYIFYIDNVNRKSNHQHMGTVVMTNLCTEITQYTCSDPNGPYGEMVATCDLATINVAKLVTVVRSETGEVIPSFNWQRLGEITRQFTRNLDRVLDRTSGVLPNEGEKELLRILADDDASVLIKDVARKMMQHINRDPTYNARRMTRAIGIGIMGFASCCALMGYEYTSTDCLSLGTRIRAAIEWHSKDESANLTRQIDPVTGKEKGSYPTFAGSPMSKGILQHDMWMEETEYMKNYISGITIASESSQQLESSGELYFREFDEPDFVKLYTGACKRYAWKEIDPSSFGVNSTWNDLREKVKMGLRNSLTTCQMPNATTSGAFGVSASIEPFYEMYFTADNANGKDTTVYDVLRDTFINHDVYEPEKIGLYIQNNKGRIEGLHMLYEGDINNTSTPRCIVKELEKLFTNSFSINKKKYLLFIQMMGYYVDQAQSTNNFFAKPNASYAGRLSYMIWANGGKTEYYLRRLGGEKIDPFMDTSNTAEQVCTMKGKPGCFACE